MNLHRVQVFGPQAPRKSPRDSEVRGFPNTLPTTPRSKEERKERDVYEVRRILHPEKGLGLLASPESDSSARLALGQPSCLCLGRRRCQIQASPLLLLPSELPLHNWSLSRLPSCHRPLPPALEAVEDSVPFSAPPPSHCPQGGRLRGLCPPLPSLLPGPATLLPGLVQEEGGSSQNTGSWSSRRVGAGCVGGGVREWLQTR